MIDEQIRSDIDEKINEIESSKSDHFIYEKDKEDIIEQIITELNLDEEYKNYIGEKIEKTFSIIEFTSSINTLNDKDSALYSYNNSDKNRFTQLKSQISIKLGSKNADNIDTYTNEILKEIPRPDTENDFKIKGQIMGQVQSGKTTIITALINKCFDAGYEVAIVNTGVIELLRKQGQLRIKKDCYDNFKSNTYLVTSIESDIKSTDQSNINNASKILSINKRNPTVTGYVLNYITDNKNTHLTRPTIIIADESDEATIDDTSEKSNNKAIKELINAIDKVCYIGFSATPNANLFIDYKNEDDLFPTDFIKYFESAETYVGPEEFFGENAYPYVRSIIDNEEDKEIQKIFNENRNGEITTIDKIPDLKKAINNFLLVGAIRILRGSGNQHNTMLINIDSIRDSHININTIVNKYIEELKTIIDKKNINKNEYNSFKSQIKELWDDINLNTIKVKNLDKEKGLDYKYELNYKLEEIMEEVETYLKEKLEISVVNGETKNILQYEEKEDTGLHVIAIGSKMFSRGYTLSGLTITYFLKPSYNADTLLQSGRFFSHYTDKGNYRDLVRLYTSENAIINFKIANKLNTGLINKIKEMGNKGKKPYEFGISMEKIKSNLTDRDILPAGKQRIRDAEEICIAKGIRNKMLEMSAFYDDEKILNKNLQVFKSMIDSIEGMVTNNPLLDEISGTRLYKLDKNDKTKSIIKKFFEEFAIPAKSKINIDIGKSEFNGDINTMIDTLLDEIKHFNVLLVGTRSKNKEEITKNIKIGLSGRKKVKLIQKNAYELNDGKAYINKDLDYILSPANKDKIDKVKLFKEESNNTKTGTLLVYIQDIKIMNKELNLTLNSNLPLFTLYFPGKNDSKQIFVNAVYKDLLIEQVYKDIEDSIAKVGEGD